MTQHGDIIMDLMVIAGAATLVSSVFNLLRLPSIIGFITAGVLVGPFGLGYVSSASSVHYFSELGIILLMFTIGLEISLEKLKFMRRAFLYWGSGQVGLTVLIFATIAALILELPPGKALFYGFLAALSSSAIVMRSLEQFRDRESPQGNSLVGILIFQDIMVIPMALSVPLLAGGNDAMAFSVTAIGLILLKFAGIIACIILLSKVVMPLLFNAIIKAKNRDLFFFFVLFVCFGVAALAETSGFSFSLGAFVAGLMISESPYGKQAMSEIIPLRDNFLGIFFISIGMMLDPQFVVDHFGWIALMVVTIGVLKGGATLAAGSYLKYPSVVLILVSGALAHIGEFSFVLAEIGRDYGLMSDQQFQYFLAVSILTMFVAPVLYKSLHQQQQSKKVKATNSDHVSKDDAAGQHQPLHDHTIVIGYGVVGQDIANAMQNLGLKFHVIDMNYTAIKKLVASGQRATFGDASQGVILEEAHLETAKLVVITASGKMTQRILNAIRRVREDVFVIVSVQFLMEARDLELNGPCHLVIAEYETSAEVLSSALATYGVAEEIIRDFLTESRLQLQNELAEISDAHRQLLNPSSWHALSAAGHLSVPEGAFSVGKSISDLDVRRNTGASIISIYRTHAGTIMAKPDLTIQAGDTINMLGDHAAITKATEYLSAKQAPSSYNKATSQDLDSAEQT